MRIKLGIPLTLGEIAKATGAHLNGDENEVITHLSTDTRELSLGDLFIAIKGEHFDGNSFARDAANKGALVMSSSEQSTIKSSDGKALLLSHNRQLSPSKGYYIRFLKRNQ